MFSIFKRKDKLGSANAPWNGRTSIYAFIKDNLDNQTERLPKDLDKLPDDNIRFKEGEMRWVAGGMDGAFGHHGGGNKNVKQSKKIAHLLKAISRSGKEFAKVKLYKILQDDSLMDYIDKALEEAIALHISPDPYLHSFARFLAKESPDRGPVKFGIALLGIVRDPKDKPVITLLGKHDEFTLFSAVALTNMSEDPEMELYHLAQCVDGWGRIHLVERLKGTANKRIKEWMILNGYKNNIMYEYLAFICAQTGNLKKALDVKSLDKGLFDSSGDLIEALISGGPARDISDYEDAADVISMYLHHFTDQPKDLKHYLVLHAIKDYLSSDNWDVEERKSNGWQPGMREQVLTSLDTLLGDSEWRSIAEKGLQSSDAMVFFEAERAARHLGIETWAVNWQRLKENPSDSGRWYHIMSESNTERIDRILSLAESAIPLDIISTGPSDNIGLGPKFNWHFVLDFILQDLNQYPGKGEKFILTGLQSPVIRNRNMALKALAAWDLDIRGKNIREGLERAYEMEPDTDVKERIKKVIEGKEID
jgi:hypothetical protein